MWPPISAEQKLIKLYIFTRPTVRENNWDRVWVGREDLDVVDRVLGAIVILDYSGEVWERVDLGFVLSPKYMWLWCQYIPGAGYSKLLTSQNH